MHIANAVIVLGAVCASFSMLGYLAAEELRQRGMKPLAVAAIAAVVLVVAWYSAA
jgi:hypothetical protein